MTNQYRNFNLNILKTIIAFCLILGSFQKTVAQGSCYATATSVSFPSGGGNQTTTAQGGCSDGSSFYFQIGTKPSWITSAYNTGNTIFLTAAANTGGSRSGTVQMIREGVQIGVFSVSQAAGGPPPVGQVSITSGPTSLCQGTTSSDYNASASNATSYSWSLENGGVASINASTGLVTWNNFFGTATVRVTAYGANNSSSTDTRNVTVTAVSQPNLQASTNEICPGEQVTFTLGPLASSTRYELLRNGQPSGLEVTTNSSGQPGGTSWNVTLGGTYSVRATQQTSPNCTITYDSENITVLAGLGSPSIDGPNQVCSVTPSTDFDVLNGPIESTYSWSILNGGPATINANTGVVNWNGFTGTATIRLTATAECGDSGFWNSSVTVNAAVTWYADSDGDGYKDPGGQEIVQCDEPTSGSWTSSPQPVDDVCPNDPYSQSGSNGCNPACLPFSTNPGTVTFDDTGGTQTSTVEFGCTTGYNIGIGTIPDNADNWLAITLINGNVLNIVCQPGTESKDVTVNLTVNGSSGGGIRVIRNPAPPPPPDPCTAVDIADVVFSSTADSQNVTVTLSGNCQGTTDLEHPYEEIPQWLNITKAGNTFTLSVQDNASGNTQSTLLIPVLDDGAGNRTPIGNFFQVTQTSCLTAWYPDSDGDSMGDVYGNPIIGCNDPDNDPNDDPNTSWVANNDDLCPDTFGTAANQGCPAGQIPENYNTVTNRGYQIDNTLVGAGKTYYDELGKPFQIQSWDILNDNMWASEIRYDLHGRSALQTLSAPIRTGNNFLYKDGFIKQSNNSMNYDVNDFTGTNLEDPNTVGNANQTLGWYYSESNTNEVYQDITEHPFSSTIYSDLNPGSVLRVVGGNKVDTNSDGVIDTNDSWAQSYTFTMRASQELSQSVAFGSTEYDDDKIAKTVTRGTQGVENIVFADSDGRILATSRSGPDGIESNPLTIDIEDQGYVDIHVPDGITGFTVNGSASVTVYDLITEQTITSSTISLPNGFYRVAVDDPDTYISGSVTVTYTVNYYDYALNEYDEAGRMIASYQPLGSTLANKPKTEYQYDAMGQLVYIKSPDEGEAWFKYRKDGKIRFSQNSQQKAANTSSFTNYDSYGRPIESGVADNVNDFNALDADAPLGAGHLRTEVLVTRYDVEPTEDYSLGLGSRASVYPAQHFLSGNVSFTNNGRQATWYSYDIYGRIEWLIMDIAGLGTLTERYKTIDYEYDPITGLVNRVIYQKDENDQFIHQYSYDDANQLIRVETSVDGIDYTIHAEYSYYEVGAMKRMELAGGAQGVDYVYNLLGQLKSLNHPTLNSTSDPGGDNNDVFGMQIDYHVGDYKRSTNTNIGISSYGNDQWNGNIRGLRWSNSHPTISESEYVYSYDRNAWLTSADFDPANTGGGTPDPDLTDNSVYISGQTAILEASQSYTLLPGFQALSGSTVTVRINPNAGSNGGDYDVSNITYDANGNIQSLVRNKGSQNGNNAMDQLAYTYNTTPQDGPNQLLRVNDAAGDVVGAEDIGDQTATENYIYNDIGQLTENLSEGITYIYNSSGLVAEVQKNGQPLVKFFYSDRNQRVKKERYSNGNLVGTTIYVRDVAGKIMAIYDDGSGSMSLIEQPVYGLERIGVAYNGTNNAKTYVYELKDHLGNVRSLFTKVGSDAQLEGYTDYYPFGMPMPDRQEVDANGYRYAYQGQERDLETGKEAFEARLWDARIGRWLTIDPADEFFSPYLGMGNNPVNVIDPDGRCTTCPDNAKKGDIIKHPEHGKLTFDGTHWVNSAGDNQLDGVTVFADGSSELPENLFWYRAERTLSMFGESATVSHFSYWTGDATLHEIDDLIKGANLSVGFTSNASSIMLAAGLGGLSIYGNTYSPSNRQFNYSPRVSSSNKLPLQVHHFATNKNSVWTPRLAKIADDFGLDLNGAWNKATLPHLGRHPNAYHQFVYDGMRRAASEAGGSQAKFLELYNLYVKQPIINNPQLLRSAGWQ